MDQDPDRYSIAPGVSGLTHFTPAPPVFWNNAFINRNRNADPAAASTSQTPQAIPDLTHQIALVDAALNAKGSVKPDNTKTFVASVNAGDLAQRNMDNLDATTKGLIAMAEIVKATKGPGNTGQFTLTGGMAVLGNAALRTALNNSAISPAAGAVIQAAMEMTPEMVIRSNSTPVLRPGRGNDTSVYSSQPGYSGSAPDAQPYQPVAFTTGPSRDHEPVVSHHDIDKLDLNAMYRDIEALHIQASQAVDLMQHRQENGVTIGQNEAVELASTRPGAEERMAVGPQAIRYFDLKPG